MANDEVAAITTLDAILPAGFELSTIRKPNPSHVDSPLSGASSSRAIKCASSSIVLAPTEVLAGVGEDVAGASISRWPKRKSIARQIGVVECPSSGLVGDAN